MPINSFVEFRSGQTPLAEFVPSKRAVHKVPLERDRLRNSLCAYGDAEQVTRFRDRSSLLGLFFRLFRRFNDIAIAE
jgi:hypothetical protein